MLANPILQHYPVAASNLFLMTSFAETKHHHEISRAVKTAVNAFGLEFIRADDTDLRGNNLWQKVELCMEACEYGIAVFEKIDRPEFNPNVSLELGYMLGLKRQCLLLKERQLPALMADLGGFLYKQFDAENITASILGEIAKWLQEIGVRKASNERLIVFVSGGGTCRCAISKAITRHHLADTKIDRFRAESRAAFDPSRPTATNAAITLVRETYGADLLSDHRPRRMGVGFLYEADLILATDIGVLERVRQLHTTYPGDDADKAKVEAEIRRKSHLLTEFFGSTGNVLDPWPDRGDEASHAKYKTCLATLQGLIEPNEHKLTVSRPASPPIAFGTATLAG